MGFPALNAYLERLARPGLTPSSLRLNRLGQVEGQFFNCSLGSAFQPIRCAHGGAPAGVEALVRGAGGADAGPSLWRQLDHAASDDESVELDRLCRMLHAINFFRQAHRDDGPLYLSVHDRLLGAVSVNHGHAFRRILDALGLPAERVVLQLPLASVNQRWLLHYVTDNYKRNGFQMALRLSDPARAADLLAQIRPAALVVDAASVDDDNILAQLLAEADAHQARLIVRKVETAPQLARLAQLSAVLGVPLQVQGLAVGVPAERLRPGTSAPLAPPNRHAPEVSFCKIS